MAREHDQKREEQQAELAPVEAAPAAPESTTKFTGAGAIPDVAPVTTAAAPSASELAYDAGPGVQKLDELLAKGEPDPDKVVELIDAHRGETQAMFALIEKKLGAGFAGQVRDAMDLRMSIKRKEVVAGDPTNENDGYFIASAKDQGARWRTKNGTFKGKAGKDGVDATYRIDSDDQIHAKTDKKGNGTIAWERDGENMGELYRSDKELGARKSWELGENGDLTAGLRNRKEGDNSTNEAFVTHTTDDKKLTSTGAVGVHEGELAAMAGVTYKPNERDTYAGSITHNADGTRLNASATKGLDGGAKLTGAGELMHNANGNWTGSISGAYENKDRRIDGSIARTEDQTNFHFGATEKLSPNLSLYGSLDHAQHDVNGGQTTLRLGERYRAPNLVHDFNLEAGTGQKDYLQANGSLDARLAPNLYGGAFGSFRVEDGHQTTAQLGASLTFTPSEKTALTLAGLVDEHGSLETRLQLDVFKSKINSVGALADHKKDALFSLFVSYQQGSGASRLDDRYGSAMMSTPVDDRVMAGIKIKF